MRFSEVGLKCIISMCYTVLAFLLDITVAVIMLLWTVE